MAQRATYSVLYSSLFGPDGAVNYYFHQQHQLLLNGSRCIRKGAHMYIICVYYM